MSKLAYLGERRTREKENARTRTRTRTREERENARAGGFAARSRVLARLASLAEIVELASRLIKVQYRKSYQYVQNSLK